MPPIATTPSHLANLEAERTVLGALLTDPDAIIKIGDRLMPVDFCDPVLADIYRSIRELWEEGSPVDFLTVSDKLKNHAKVQAAGGSAFLADISHSVPTASHVEKYAEIVLEQSRRRQLAALGRRLEALAKDEELSADELLDQSGQEFLRLSQRSKLRKPVTLAAMRDERLERYAHLHESDDPSQLLGIRTGFAQIDEMLNLTPGDLVVLAARPSMGKTALALNIARHVVFEQGKSVTIVSQEMDKEPIFDRLFGSIANIEPWKLSKGLLSEDEFEKLGPAFDQLDKQQLYIDDDPDRRLSTIRTKAHRQKVEHGLDLLIIDYLQLIQVTDRLVRDSRTREMSHISENIKQLARELQCPVIALSQLSRAVENRPDKKPQLSDLRDSGTIEQDADSVIMLYRESYYHEDCEDPGLTDVFLRKNRQGPTGHVELQFDKPKMTFYGRTER